MQTRSSVFILRAIVGVFAALVLFHVFRAVFGDPLTVIAGIPALLLTLALICALPTAFGWASSFVAQSKGYDANNWFWLGFAGGPLALLAICGAGDRRLQQSLQLRGSDRA